MKCPICEKEFKNERACTMHMLKVHPGECESRLASGKTSKTEKREKGDAADSWTLL